ncbi:MAG: NAD(P)H-hydrate epimerase, partial [Actinobacteria bacterium]|nr:NAD(P)H-hydrate epimerase [Actinomycetota bacterium]NIS37122.1 NAD(P)H-hydrate epimerase [Actinomycetota bacterium]NIU22707.1 NAD(P)H-hydrate epimerase [Actinomycetota bacterium]NIU71574.1 NAD(P)H-hydrate epimerase [Actinomycetota bacterium]NIV90913.1 NAD(P)H-hydrate epimerase [Actinomycetota bacterium]
QMAEADRLAIEEFGISLLQMMEHAGSNLAGLVNALAPEGTVTVLAGGGNNGGGGLCAARHLINSGRRVDVVLSSNRVGPAPAHHLRTLAAMG